MKIEKIPMCGKCANRIVESSCDKFNSSTLVGCKELSRKKWEEGWLSVDGAYRQTLCPLIKIEREEKCES